MPTSYAAALASAASAAPEKKKRKPECPMRKHDTEPTETIVPSKKRKFIQLFRWCHSSTPTGSAPSDGELSPDGADVASCKQGKTPAKRADNNAHQKPKIKPKLKGTFFILLFYFKVSL